MWMCVTVYFIWVLGCLLFCSLFSREKPGGKIVSCTTHRVASRAGKGPDLTHHPPAFTSGGEEGSRCGGRPRGPSLLFFSSKKKSLFLWKVPYFIVLPRSFKKGLLEGHGVLNGLGAFVMVLDDRGPMAVGTHYPCVALICFQKKMPQWSNNMIGDQNWK